MLTTENLYYSSDSEQPGFSLKLLEVFECSNPLHTGGGTISRAKSDCTAVRVYEDSGAVSVKNKKFDLPAGAFFIADTKEISEISAEGEKTLIFRFDYSGSLPFFSKNQVYSIEATHEENELVTRLFTEKPADSKLSVAVKNSLFTMLFAKMIKKRSVSDTHKTSYHQSILKMIRSLEENPGMQVSIGELAEEIHLSERMFRKVFTLETGLSPNYYIQKLRLRRAKELLCDPALSIGEISETLGYSSQFRFCLCFKKEYGASPSAYRKDL